MTTHITIIDRSASQQPPLIRMDTEGNAIEAQAPQRPEEALVARVMLQAAAYLFAHGQAVEFGEEVPREVLR
ncbi:hypothetical protein KBW71_02120 [Hydrogenophaga aromaticivorans]|uniref:hypothetical protein n=1 Tax=Hydrogenophaga aromaticivorans TaxID=2610898 RepID=UPI001B38E934|nr:hypothetical protein [Hydrogenophaga aromaticivorans]MBQ0917227.1 hypothetical protein [Hydrogenophaga aromaticivorans]